MSATTNGTAPLWRSTPDARLLALPWCEELTVRRPCEGIRWSRVPLGGPVPPSAHCTRRARYRYDVLPESQRTDGAVSGHYCVHHVRVVAWHGNVERARIVKLERQRAAAAHARASKRRTKISAVPGEGTPVEPTPRAQPDQVTATA